MKKLKILDFYCHQGHQYEFFKTGHNFYLCGLNSLPPEWNEKHRPLPKNVSFINEINAKYIHFDVVIVRSPLNPKRYAPFIKRGAVPVAVVQTTDPFPMHPKVRHIVWNSKVSMDRKDGYYGRHIKNYYIVHGYDPNEFVSLDMSRNKRVLSAINVFEKRAQFVGFELWSHINKETNGVCDVLGHGNDDIEESIGEAGSLSELIKTYNTYSIYFNPTNNSAMPRSRAEAAMCGMPIVSTNNFDINMYFNDKTAILSNSPDELAREIKRLLSSKQMMNNYGELSRKTAIKHFHIDDYIAKWNDLFRSL